MEPMPDLPKIVPVEQRSEKVDTKKFEADSRERRKRYADREREAARTKFNEHNETAPAPIMAFGGDEPRVGAGFLGIKKHGQIT